MFGVVNMYLDHLKSCVVEGISVVVNVQPNSAHGGKSMYFWSFCLRGELGFLNCNNICMCVVKKQFELHEFVLILFLLTCSIMRLILLLLLGLCACVWCVVI